MDLKGCRDVFLLVILGATAMIGGNPTIIADTKLNGGVMLTCTYEDTHSPAWDIKIRWSHHGASKLITTSTSEYSPFSSAIDIQQYLVTYQNIGTLCFSCIVEEYDPRNGINTPTIKLERWVLSMDLVKALIPDYPVIKMVPRVLEAGDIVHLTCAYKWTSPATTIDIKWYLRRGSGALVEQKKPIENRNASQETLQQIIKRKVTEKNNGDEYICIITDTDDYNGDKYLLSQVLEVKPKDTTTTTTSTTSRDKITSTSRSFPSTIILSTAGTKSQASHSDPTLQAVTLTLIFILVAAVIVLAVFLIRMKRNITEKPPKDSGTQPLDDFDEYAHPGGPARTDDIYRSLGKGRRIPGQMNAAFEPEGADYIDVFEKGGQVGQ